MLMVIGIIGAIIILSIIIFVVLSAMYTVVEPSEAHVIIAPNKEPKRFVAAANPAYGDITWYFNIPSWIPYIGRNVKTLNVTIKELVFPFETVEKNQARFNVITSTKYKIKNVLIAADNIDDDAELKKQLAEIVKAGVTAVTTQYEVVAVRSRKSEIEAKIRAEIAENFNDYGVELKNFQVVDFTDTKDSKIMSNISLRSEKAVETTTREQNAEKEKVAKMKEIEAKEKAEKREFEKQQVVGEAEQLKIQKIAEMQKEAKEKEYDVKQVEVKRTAEITKEQAKIKAQQDKEVAIIAAEQKREAEKIIMEQKRLEGEGDRKRAEEQAKGNAAKFKEDGLAEAAAIEAKGLSEAKAKDALKKSLDGFSNQHVEAMIANPKLEVQKAIGVSFAKAYETAKMTVFAGGSQSDKAGFDYAKMIEAVNVASPDLADAMKHNRGVPNDLGGGVPIVDKTKQK